MTWCPLSTSPRANVENNCRTDREPIGVNIRTLAAEVVGGPGNHNIRRATTVNVNHVTFIAQTQINLSARNAKIQQVVNMHNLREAKTFLSRENGRSRRRSGTIKVEHGGGHVTAGRTVKGDAASGLNGRSASVGARAARESRGDSVS